MFEEFFLGLIGLGIFLILFSYVKWGRKKDKKAEIVKKIKKGDKIEIALEKLNVIWRDKEKVELAISDLARIWKSLEEAEKELIEEIPEFKNDEVLEFYLNYLRGRVWFSGKVREVILEILKILDEKGDCSSVVSGKNESYELDKNLYDLIAEINLREHSLRVAKKCFEFGVSGLSEPKVVITALAHDLGKIPEYHKEFYSLGDHPIISVQVLRGIRWFKDLSYAEEVEKAILYHHKTGKGDLVEILKKADTLARREEVEIAKERRRKKENERIVKDLIKRFEDKEKEKEETKQEVKQEEAKQEIKQEEIKQEEVKQETRQEEIKQEVMQKTSKVVKKEKKKVEKKEAEEEDDEVMIYKYDLSWLSVEEFIEALRKEVNRIRGNKWIAFSMPNGVVYVHPTGLWQILKKLAMKEDVLEILTMEGDNNLKRSVLVSLVGLLRKKGYIEEELIKEGYFAAPFLVYKKGGGEPVRVLYTPFKAEALGNGDLSVVSEFEKIKRGTIIELIEKVEPDYSFYEEEE